MRSSRVFRTAVLIATMAVTSAGAATIDEEGGPNGAVDLTETPPTVGNCRPPVATMIGPSTGYPTTTLTVRNRTLTTRSQDALVIRVVEDGKLRMFWVPLDLSPQAAVSVRVDFFKRLDSSEVVLCGDRPGGVTEGDSPVVGVTIDPEIPY